MKDFKVSEPKTGTETVRVSQSLPAGVIVPTYYHAGQQTRKRKIMRHRGREVRSLDGTPVYEDEFVFGDWIVKAVIRHNERGTVPPWVVALVVIAVCVLGPLAIW